jgi:hypothetical protein
MVRGATGNPEPLWQRRMLLPRQSRPRRRTPPSHGWNNRDLVPIRQHRLLARQKADIFIIAIQIHELPQRSPLITQLGSESGEIASQLLQHSVDRGPCRFDGTLLLGELHDLEGYCPTRSDRGR